MNSETELKVPGPTFIGSQSEASFETASGMSPGMALDVINPATGEIVHPGQLHYDEYKAALGGDAGTVELEKSTAIAAARETLAAASLS